MPTREAVALRRHDEAVKEITIKALRTQHRRVVARIRDLAAERSKDARIAGNRDAARYITEFGADLIATIKPEANS